MTTEGSVTTPSPRRVEKSMLRRCLDAAIWIVRLATYPFRWIALVIVRIVRLCAATLPPVLLSVLLFQAIAWMKSHGSSLRAKIEPIEQHLADVIGNGNYVQLVGLIGSAIVFGWALRRIGEAAWEEALEMWVLFTDTLKDDWVLRFNILDSIEEIVGHLAEVWKAFVESWGSFGRMSLIILAATPVVLMLLAVHWGLMIWRASSLGVSPWVKSGSDSFVTTHVVFAEEANVDLLGKFGEDCGKLNESQAAAVCPDRAFHEMVLGQFLRGLAQCATGKDAVLRVAGFANSSGVENLDEQQEQALDEAYQSHVKDIVGKCEGLPPDGTPESRPEDSDKFNLLVANLRAAHTEAMLNKLAMTSKLDGIRIERQDWCSHRSMAKQRYPDGGPSNYDPAKGLVNRRADIRLADLPGCASG